MLNVAIRSCEQTIMDFPNDKVRFNDCIGWLRNKLQSLRPQPKQKDRFWEGYIKGLSEARKPPFNIEDWLTEKEEADEQDKQPHWKPSEEQMDWLATAVRLSADKPAIHKVIASLYNDLEKLM